MCKDICLKEPSVFHPMLAKEICGPDHCHNKKEMQWIPKLVQKETLKEDFKNLKKNDGIALHYHKTGHAIDF